MEAKKFFEETLAYVENYHKEGTRNAILKAIDQLKVGTKGRGLQDLKVSIRTEVRRSGTTIIGETFFLTYGRFRDMGTSPIQRRFGPFTGSFRYPTLPGPSPAWPG